MEEINDLYFTYPLNNKYITRKQKSIKKNLLKKERLVEKNIAILGGSSTSEIRNILELFLLNIGIKANYYESEYNKFFEDALFSNDELNIFQPDIIYLHTSNVNISNYPEMNQSFDDIEKLLFHEVNKYKSIWESLSKFNCAIIQNNFDFPIHRSLGNLDSYDVHGKTYYINRLNFEFAKSAREIDNLYINDINYLSSYIGLEKWFDKSLWFQAKYAMSINVIPDLAFNISKIINSIVGQTKKCLVLDLDNTCWGGVIGDDGIEGIQIGTETPIAESFVSFQKFVKELHNRGISLAVCSKNDLQNAKEGFNHPDSILRLNNFTSFKANWKPKHENIIEISQDLNIGVDSLVFIDDNPVEREIVSKQVPNVSVPNVGSDATDFIDFIDKNGYFEPISLSKDDMNRSEYYKDNIKRIEQQSFFESYDDFLTSLDMKAEIKSFSKLYIDRITQLTNKTNQFNLTTKRYTSGEIVNITNSNKYIKICGRLIDKYGDNGIVAITIGKIQKNTCHIDLWLMSCRVLKRNMEFAMLDQLVAECKKKGIIEILGYYFKSQKNNMVSDLYENFGFKLESRNGKDSTWSLNIVNYKNKNKLIGVNCE